MQIMVYWLKIFNLDITKENKHDIILITINPSKIVIITGGNKILKADFPEAFRIGISFEFDNHEKVSIELSIIMRAIASKVSIGILKKIFNIALFASSPLEEKKFSWSDPSIKRIKKSTVSKDIPKLWRYLMEIYIVVIILLNLLILKTY